ncbi:MAG: PepSY domain-containing protein [Gammaproteobacteria bacterium]|nr:PepSY domain-containing protein [Gammaproteobacteria bacterium]
MKILFGAINTQRLHLWCGLFAAIWLSVLGITGFILDHRDNWRWMWQSGLNQSFLPKDIVDKSRNSSIRLYQKSPHSEKHELSGGMTGLWWRTDISHEWQASKFVNSKDKPLVYQILFNEMIAGHVWLASDNGVWYSKDNGQHFRKLALSNQSITAIDQSNKNVLYIVDDRSQVYKLDTITAAKTEIQLRPLAKHNLPESISLSRFVRDLHYGRGVNTVSGSLLWNDIAGLAMVILPITGFLFYWLPKRWRHRKSIGDSISHSYKQHTMRWLFRLHGPSMGLITFIPVVYISLTGIFLGHNTLREWMKPIQVTHGFQTPVYDINEWQGHIYGIVVRNNGDIVSLGTRLGVFSTNDEGETWVREGLWRDKAVFAWTVRKIKDNLIVGGMGSPNFIYKGSSNNWSKINSRVHMPTDVTMYKRDILLKNNNGLWRINQNEKKYRENIELPFLNYIPWYYVVDGLHSGVLIHAQWKWINDLIAVLAIVLVFTGLMRWWKTRWI